MIRTCLVALSALCLWTPGVFAQGVPSDGGPDPAIVRVRIGPLLLSPTIDLTNAGVDTNVFDEPAEANPKRDFTVTVVPKAKLWLPIGRSWLSGEVDEEIVWYQKYTGERSANDTYDVGWKVPLNRLSFDVGAKYLRTRDRPGFEIDARLRRMETSFRGKAELRALSKTFFGVDASRLKVEYDQNAVFLGSNLETELGRVVTTAGLTVRQQVTPLTSVTVAVAREDDRFDFSPLRDSQSTMGTVSVTFDPVALIKGSAKVGYRDFEPVQRGLPAYQGLIAGVDLSYVLLGMTKFGIQVGRDVQYSYDINQPYYLQTGVAGSISQQIFGPLDVVGRAGVQDLAYRDRAGAAVAVADRTDTVVTYGGGLGYHLGPELRIGFNIDHANRSSLVADRRYDGLRYGTSVTYGF